MINIQNEARLLSQAFRGSVVRTLLDEHGVYYIIRTDFFYNKEVSLSKIKYAVSRRRHSTYMNGKTIFIHTYYT